MLKTTRSSDLALKKLRVNEVVGSGGKADNRNLSKSKKSKNAQSEIQTRIKVTGKPTFLAPDAIEILNQLR